MKRSKRHQDAEIDRLLGDDPTGFPDEIVELVERLRSESARQHTPPDMAASLAAESRRVASADSGFARTSRPLPRKWRRRIMLSTFLSSLAGKLAIGSVALATTTGGLAATGNLPDPVQDWAANQLAQINIEIPDSADTDVDVTTADTADDVLGVVDGTPPEDRDQEFGENVADTASDGESTDGLTRAEDGADNAGEYDDVADQYTDEIPDGEPAELPDESGSDQSTPEVPDEADSGSDAGDQGSAFLP